MNILVTGGAGYIGSVLAEELVRNGHRVVVLDNLARGHRNAVTPEATFVEGDLRAKDAIEDVFRRYPIEVVMHLAADISVEHSMADPGRFFRNNVVCGMNLLDCMLRYQVKRLIFSSSAAVYGHPEELPVTEATPVNPINAYGESKAMFERILHYYEQSHSLKYISLRYFNVAGASERFGADHNPDTSLIPSTIKVALGQREHVPIFGIDYDTKDGTCIRDYVHVLDIARAHILALSGLEEYRSSRAYNLGNGEGYSVIEVIEAARRVTRARIQTQVCPKRRGDPARLVASYELAKAEMGWTPQCPGLESIIETAWEWHKEHPWGYRQLVDEENVTTPVA